MTLIKSRLSAHLVDGLKNAFGVEVEFYRTLQTVLYVLKPQNILTRFRILGLHGLVFRTAFLVLVQEILSTKVV